MLASRLSPLAQIMTLDHHNSIKISNFSTTMYHPFSKGNNLYENIDGC